jgi:hypothetical protein
VVHETRLKETIRSPAQGIRHAKREGTLCQSDGCIPRVFNKTTRANCVVANPLPVRAFYCADLLNRFELTLAKGQND